MTEVNNPRSVSHLFFPGTVVFGPAASPAAFAALDISAVVGVRSALVLIKAVQTGGAVNTIKIRMDGDAIVPTGVGCAAGQIAVGDSLYLICPTSAAGILDWDTQQAETITLTVLAYGVP